MALFLLTILVMRRPWAGLDLPEHGDRCRRSYGKTVKRNSCIVYLGILYTCLVGPLNVSALQTVDSGVSVTRLTYQITPGCTAAVIYLSGPLEFHKQCLRQPERLYFDLKNASIGTGFKRLYPVDEDLVKAIRVGQFDRDTVRIVFDLRTDRYDVNAVFLKDPDRIRVHICQEQKENQSRVKQSSSHAQTLIPKENWITDFAARLALARILAYEDHTLKEALAILRRMRETHPNDPETLVALADLEANLGHAAMSRDLYMDAVRMSDQPEIVKLKFADRMNMWGDFHKAETVYKDHIRTHPEEADAVLRLAALMRSSERYGESEGIYKRLLFESPDSKEILMALAGLKLLEKNFDAAGKLVDRFLELDPHNPEGLLLKAEILFLQKRYEEALSIYSRLSEMKCCHIKGLIGMGKVYLEQGKDDLAGSCFAEACESDPQNVEARFYAAGLEKVTSGNFMNALIENPTISPMILDKWARLYATHGFNKIAIKCYEASLARDPDYFPSQIGLAEVLAIDHQYDRATKQFEALAQTFPDNRKILIGWARALGWGRRYDESIELYNKIHGIAPSDPVPQMERARTAAWAKEMDVAAEAYEGLLTPPVDKALAESLKPVAAASGNPGLANAVSKLADRAEEAPPFRALRHSVKI